MTSPGGPEWGEFGKPDTFAVVGHTVVFLVFLALVCQWVVEILIHFVL